MKKLVNIVFIFLLFVAQPCFAKEYKVLVLPDTLMNKVNDYFVYPEASELVSTDVIRYLNNVPSFNAPQVSTVKSTVNKYPSLKANAVALMKNFKVNYNIDFEALSRLNMYFKADLALMVTSNIDVQNYFLRRTIWDALNIPGATVVDPAYRVSTQVYLIDIRNKRIMWQHTYQKLISSRESRMVAVDYSPQTEQMERVKTYSERFLAPQITQEMQLVVYNVDEFSNLNNHPEIVKPHPVSVDSLKVNSRRSSVITGRYIKKKTKQGVKRIKTGTQNMKEKRKANKIKRQELSAKKKAEKAVIKQNKLREKEILKIQKENKNLVSPDALYNNDQKVNNTQGGREIDVILIKEEPKFEDVEFVPVKQRNYNGFQMLNDL